MQPLFSASWKTNMKEVKIKEDRKELALDSLKPGIG